MKPLLFWLSRRYPQPWRRRYGPELDQLIEDSSTTWRDVPGLLIGALSMHYRYALISSPFRAAAALALLGAILAALSLAFIPRQYRSTETIRISQPGASRDVLSERLWDSVMKILTPPELMKIATDQGLYSSRPDIKVDDLVLDMRQRIRFVAPMREFDGSGFTFLLSYDHSDPRRAQAVAGELGKRLLTISELPLSVANPASLPKQAFTPRPSAILLFGALAGALAGLLVALLLRRRRATPSLPPLTPAPSPRSDCTPQ
jgi:hypothetical protein